MTPFVIIILLFGFTYSLDITNTVFGGNIKATPAAFGDFNSDELTDLFVIRNNTVDVLLSYEEGEPLLRSSKLTCTLPGSVTSVVPGDFNGDAYMDALVTWRSKGEKVDLKVSILWGQLKSLNCTTKSLFTMRGEPLAIDFNNDFITDLFGVDEFGRRSFWVFEKNETYTKKLFNDTCASFSTLNTIRNPHSNAFLDLNNDCVADIFVTSGKGEEDQLFEIWEGQEDQTFKCMVLRPPDVPVKKMGQSLFLDVELTGKMDQLLPIQTDTKPALFAFSPSTKSWHELDISFKDPAGVQWQWAWSEDEPLQRAITVRGGDYSMDGYPDLLAPLQNSAGAYQTVLLENTPCSKCGNFSRTFTVKWDAFYPHGNSTVAGAFFDIFQDGIMDVILVYKEDDGYSLGAFKNDLDYDANFIKVMVISGLRNEATPYVVTRLGKKKTMFGSNLPGPRIWYRTVDQEGKLRAGVSAQIPQSAHFALILPYTTFALGRTPNFVDSLSVGFASKSREWPQIIPNSQVVIIPNPVDTPARWKVQLFVTPSKVILLSVAALVGTCFVIAIVIGVLHWQERRSDRLERMQQSFRFHAM